MFPRLVFRIQNQKQISDCRGVQIPISERIFEHRIQQQVEIDDMQFGFMKGKGTTDAIFIVRQMQEKFIVKGKKLYFGFVNLEKAFDNPIKRSDKMGNE